MTRPATDLPLSPRERLRLRRALDAQLIDDIFGRALRDESPVPAYRLNHGEVKRRMTDAASAG